MTRSRALAIDLAVGITDWRFWAGLFVAGAVYLTAAKVLEPSPPGEPPIERVSVRQVPTVIPKPVEVRR